MASDTQMEHAMAIVRDAGYMVEPDGEKLRVLLEQCGCIECRRHIAADVVAGLIAAGYTITKDNPIAIGR